MDNQNISKFVDRQNRYSQQQKHFFFKKPFGEKSDLSNKEIDAIENDLIQFQDIDMEEQLNTNTKLRNGSFQVIFTKRLAQLNDQKSTIVNRKKMDITIPDQQEFKEFETNKNIDNLSSSGMIDEEHIMLINNNIVSPLSQKINIHFNMDTQILPLSSVKSQLMSPSAKSFSSQKKNGPQYVLLLNQQQNLNFQKCLYKLDVSQIQLLELCDNKLKVIPEEIYSLPQLVRLKLDNNFIKKIPSLFYTKLKLELFSIKNNLIQTLEPIPSKVFSNPGLISWNSCIKYLDISQNKIKQLDGNIGFLSQLKQFFIGSNEFKDIPRSFGYLKNLRQLSLDWFKYLNPPIEIDQTSKSLIQDLLKIIIQYPKGLSFMQFVNLFSSQGFKIDFISNRGRTLVHLAASEQDLGALDCLISQSPQSINQLDSEGQSPLSLALSKDAFFSSRLLLTKNCNVNIGLVEQGSLLSFTLDNQLVAFTGMILQRGGALLSLQQLDYSGNSPLHYLATSQVDSINLLEFQTHGISLIQTAIKNPNSLNQKNKDGWAPIHLAVLKNKIWIVKEMIKANQLVEQCSTESIDLQGSKYRLDLKGGQSELTPLQLAVFNDNSEMVQLFIEENQLDLNECNIKLSRICQNNQRLFKLLQSYEREQKELFIKSATEEGQHQINIFKLVEQRPNKIKLLSSIDKGELHVYNYKHRDYKSQISPVNSLSKQISYQQALKKQASPSQFIFSEKLIQSNHQILNQQALQCLEKISAQNSMDSLHETSLTSLIGNKLIYHPRLMIKPTMLLDFKHGETNRDYEILQGKIYSTKIWTITQRLHKS